MLTRVAVNPLLRRKPSPALQNKVPRRIIGVSSANVLFQVSKDNFDCQLTAIDHT